MPVSSINDTNRAKEIANLNDLFSKVQENKNASKTEEEDDKKNDTHTETIVEGQFVYVYLVKGDRTRKLIQKLPVSEYNKDKSKISQIGGNDKFSFGNNQELVFGVENTKYSKNLCKALELYKTQNSNDKESLNNILRKLQNKENL